DSGNLGRVDVLGRDRGRHQRACGLPEPSPVLIQCPRTTFTAPSGSLYMHSHAQMLESPQWQRHGGSSSEGSGAGAATSGPASGAGSAGAGSYGATHSASTSGRIQMMRMFTPG